MKTVIRSFICIFVYHFLIKMILIYFTYAHFYQFLFFLLSAAPLESMESLMLDPIIFDNVEAVPSSAPNEEGQPIGVAGPSNAGPSDPNFSYFKKLLLQTHPRISDTIVKIFQDLHTRVPAGFQSERLTEMLEERHGGPKMEEILKSLQEKGRNSPFFREVQTDFKDLKDSGGTDATLREDWYGRRRRP